MLWFLWHTASGEVALKFRAYSSQQIVSSMRCFMRKPPDEYLYKDQA